MLYEVDKFINSISGLLCGFVKGKATVPAMLCGLRKFQWVHAPLRYEDRDDLIPKLRAWVDTRAALEAERLIQWKAAAAAAT